MSNPTATIATPASITASLFAAENFQVIRSSRAAGPPYPICGQFSRRGPTVTRSIRPHCITIMMGRENKLHENQHLGRRADQSVPRRRGFSAEVTQSTGAADVADAAQLPRLSSARANNSASFGSFSGGKQDQPVQNTADRGAPGRQCVALARPAGNLQPGLVETFDKAEAGPRPVGVAWTAKQRHRAELAVNDARRLQLAPVRRLHSYGYSSESGPGLVEFAAGAIDFEFCNRLFALGRPAKDVLAAAFGMPKDLVSLCLFGQIELADGERRMRPHSYAPARFGGRLARQACQQFVPEMDADDGKQGQNPHIGKQRQRAAAFVGETGQGRMNSGRIMRGGTDGPKRSHQTPRRDR